jgi:hypothetical protein
MKKIIVAAVVAVILIASTTSLYTKDNTPKSTFTAMQQTVFDCKKDLAGGD